MTIFAAPNNNVAFNKVLEVELKEALVKYPRPDLDSKFAYFRKITMKLKSHSIIFAKGIIVFYFRSRDGLDVEDAAT